MSTCEWTSLVCQFSYEAYCFWSYAVDRRGQATALTSVEMLWNSCDNLVNGHRGSGCTVKGSTHPLCLFRIISKASTQAQLFSSIPYSYIQGIPIPRVQCYVKAFLSRDMHMNTQHVKDCMLLNRLLCRNGVRNFVIEGGFWCWASGHDKWWLHETCK